MNVSPEYEVVIGLEVHVQLQTKSKLFSGDSIAFGADANTQVSAISLAHPGTLPKMNRQAVEMAIKMGIACHCDINRHNFFARKNYFYPDLPKGYQVSQHTTPICEGGFISVFTNDEEKQIRLSRIHLEEDAGKSLHDIDENFTSVDFNRAGTPLIEIVSEPDLRSAEEAFTYVSEIRKLVRYLGISDGNMEEGSLRCDANISVRLRGESKLGTRVEVKNLNSIRNVKRAIEFEAVRLSEMLTRGQAIVQQTRSFDAGTGTTFAIRDKEDAEDYRYFADPDLSPFHLEEEFITKVKSSLPRLQKERISFYREKYNLPQYDASVLTEDRALADYFEETVSAISVASDNEIQATAKAAANWILGPVKEWMNANRNDIERFPIRPKELAGIIDVVLSGKVSFSVGSTKLFNACLVEMNANPLEIAENMNLMQQSDSSVLLPLVEQVIAKYPDKVREYQKGKKGLIALFVGEVMKLSKGKADPKLTNDILIEKLKG